MKGPERGQYNYVRPTIHDIKLKLRKITKDMNLNIDQYFEKQFTKEEVAVPLTEE